MNILQLVSAARTGGVERHVVVLSELLRQRGHRVTTMCPPGEWLPAQLRGAGVPVEEVTMHGVRSYNLPYFLPHYVRTHKFDLIHSHLTRATYFAYVTGRLTSCPVVSSMHVMTRDKVYRMLAPKSVNRVIAVSDYVRDALLEQGISPTRVRTIHNGTDFRLPDVPSAPVVSRLKEERAIPAGRGGAVCLPSSPTETAEFMPEECDPIRALSGGARLTVHSEWSVPQDAELIGMFARMEEFKGPFVLTQAVRKIVAARPRAYFFFVGPIEPDVQQALWEIADREGVVDRLRFTGGRDDVARLMTAMDVVTLPSRYEACSMAIIEAMMLGKPVVATRAGGNPELIEDEETGLLIERSPDSLAAALIHILSDPARKLRMGEAARHRAMTRFSAGVMVSQIESLYQEMLASR